MTANYFMVTREGIGLDGALYPPFAEGSGPNTVAVTDNRIGVAHNLIPNPSAEVSTEGWTAYNYLGSVAAFDRWSGNSVAGSRSFRLLPTSGTIRLGMTSDPIPVEAGKEYAFRASVKGVVAGRTVHAAAAWNTGATSGADLGTDTTSHVVYSDVFTAPVGATTVTLTVYIEDTGGMSYSEGCFIDALMLEQSSSVGPYVDGDSPDGTWDGTPGLSSSRAPTGSSYNTPATMIGVPADLDSVDYLTDWRCEPYPDQTMVWPTGFTRSVFRVVRDPAVVTDDSGISLGTQIYNHGWLIAERLGWMLVDLHSGHLPHYGWPLAEDLAIVPVTGTPSAVDGNGWHGLESVTWPGSGVGVGNLRQLLSGDEGADRKVATILDRLAATTSGQRTTIGNNYSSNASAIRTAYSHLQTALGYGSVVSGGWPWPSRTTAQNECEGRAPLNTFLARAAVGEALQSNSNLGHGVEFGLAAVTALEAGLVGATFTSSDYTSMTGPIRSVISMPAGYF